MTDLERFRAFFADMGVAIDEEFDQDIGDITETEYQRHFLSVSGAHFVFNQDGRFTETINDETGEIVRRKT